MWMLGWVDEWMSELVDGARFYKWMIEWMD